MPENNLEVSRYLHHVNTTLYPGLIDAAEEWLTEGWGLDDATPPTLATAIINNALDDSTDPKARAQMLVIAQNILNFHYRGGEWVEKTMATAGG